MSRLIDGDKLIKQLDDDIKITSEFAKKSIKYDDYRDFDKSFAILYMLKSYRAIVEDMKTAFDVEKVVEQLEKYQETLYYYHDAYTRGQMSAYDKAIKIVKVGGIDYD